MAGAGKGSAHFVCFTRGGPCATSLCPPCLPFLAPTEDGVERGLEVVPGENAVQDEEGFGNCTNHGACQNACPKGISVDFIARLNRDLVKATLTHKPYEITAV